MTADPVWQIITTVGSVAVLVGGASWKLANVLDSVKVSVIALKSEVQQEVAAVRSDVTLLRTSIDGKLALVEAQTKADIVALKAALERMDDELEKLKQPPVAPSRSRRGAA